MNSHVLYIQVVTNKKTSELQRLEPLLCMAFMFTVKAEDVERPVCRVYRLVDTAVHANDTHTTFSKQ